MRFTSSRTAETLRQIEHGIGCFVSNTADQRPRWPMSQVRPGPRQIVELFLLAYESTGEVCYEVD